MSWSLNDIPNPSFNAALDNWITHDPREDYDEDEYEEEDDDLWLEE